jgi:DNA-binding response OmpR family regulator
VKVLVVEDDVQLADLLERVFREEGHEVLLAGSIKDGERALASNPFEMVVLDRMLPDGDGLELCAKIHARQPPIAVVLLTARGELQDRLSGLRMGADDYLTKPFEVEELLARADAVFRRLNQAWISCIGALEIDRRLQTVHADGRRLNLTAREYALLVRLAECPEVCVSRSELLADVWNTSLDQGSGVLDVHLSRLRDKLGELAWMVETVRGQGLRLKMAR